MEQTWLTRTTTTSNNYAAARLQGLEADLGMTDEQYQIGLSTLFVGYVLMQVPSNAMLNYVGRPSKYIGFFVSTHFPSGETCRSSFDS